LQAHGRINLHRQIAADFIYAAKQSNKDMHLSTSAAVRDHVILKYLNSTSL
jgi:hypothetical protein